MRLVLFGLVGMLAGCSGSESHTESVTNLTWCVGYCGKLESETLSRQDPDGIEKEELESLRTVKQEKDR